MQLDFSFMNSPGATETNDTAPPAGDPDGIQGGGGALQREADQRGNILQRAAEVYKIYQDNIKATELLQAEILKGVNAGEDITTLFLKAVKALSLTVKDDLFYNQIAKTLQQKGEKQNDT